MAKKVLMLVNTVLRLLNHSEQGFDVSEHRFDVNELLLNKCRRIIGQRNFHCFKKRFFIMQKQIIFSYLVNAANKVKTINNYYLYLPYQILKMSLSRFVLICQIE